jgi:hypothetical protein
MTVQNVDYSRLSLDTALQGQFVDTLTAVVVKHCGVGVVASDVSLKLAAGSVMVQATVVTPGGIEPTSIRDSLDDACTAGTMAADFQAGVQALQGIAAVTTGVAKVDSICEPLLGDEKISTTTVPGQKPEIQTDAAADEICEPACMVGRGICVDNVCFCRAPFTGKVCDKRTISGSIRLTYVLVIATSTVLAFVGCQIAIFSSKAMSGTERKLNKNPSGPKKETWKPRQGVAT